MNPLLSLVSLNLLVLSIFGYPFIAMVASLLGLENQAVSILYRFLVVFLSLVVMVLLWPNWMRLKRKRSDYFLMALPIVFSLYFIIRAVLDSYFRGGELNSTALVTFWMFLLGVSFIPSVASGFGWKAFFYRNVSLYRMGIGVGIVASVLILTAWRNSNDTTGIFGGRMEFETLNPITIGHVGISLLIFCYGYFVSSRSLYLIKILIALLALFLGLILAIASGSRGPLLAFFAVLLFGTFLSSSIRSGYKVLSVMMMAALSAPLVVLNSESMLVSRMTEGLFNDPARIKIFEDSIAVFTESPLLGGGIMTMETYPHNFILESFVVVGVFGGILYLLINLLAFAAAGFLYRKRICIVLPLLFIQYFVAGMFSGTIHEASVYWMLVTILLCIGLASYRAPFVASQFQYFMAKKSIASGAYSEHQFGSHLGRREVA